MEACPCETFSSQPYGNWSDCIIAGDKTEPQLGIRFYGDPKECGEGIRLRAIACYDKTGRLVEPSYCSSSGKKTKKCTMHVNDPDILCSSSEQVTLWYPSILLLTGL